MAGVDALVFRARREALTHRPTARELLGRAAAIYDNDSDLRASAKAAWRHGFASGGQWMALAMSRLNQNYISAAATFDLHQIGFIKYGLAVAAALLTFLVAAALRHPVAGMLIAALAFYVVEVQMLFLFPVALAGSARPFREAFRETRRAGGTIRTIPIVMTLAAVMLFGGFCGRGFVRCWCLGCLAVCVWYDSVKQRCDAP
jgi:hypothetical protein